MNLTHAARLLSLLSLLAVAGCASGSPPGEGSARPTVYAADDPTPKTRQQIVEESRRYYRKAIAEIREKLAGGIDEKELTWLFPTVDQARAIVLDTTFASYSKAHGLQISYFAKDGTGVLWYPGNRRLLRSTWKHKSAPASSKFAPIKVRTQTGIENRTSVPITRLCFRYGSNTFNPVTKESGGDWKCVAHTFWALDRAGRMPGDPFRLSERTRVPFVLERPYRTLDSLLAECGDCAVE